jgi:hypothetical protein
MMTAVTTDLERIAWVVGAALVAVIAVLVVFWQR